MYQCTAFRLQKKNSQPAQPGRPWHDGTGTGTAAEEAIPQQVCLTVAVAFDFD